MLADILPYASIISAHKYPLLNSPKLVWIDLVASIKMDYISCFTYLKFKNLKLLFFSQNKQNTIIHKTSTF